MNNSQIWPWVLSVIGGYFAIRWQTSSRENVILRKKLSVKKESLYTEWIHFYMELINKPKSQKKTISEMRKLNESMLLIASNKVLLTYGDLMQSLYISKGGKNSIQLLRLIGEMIVAMREDLGHKDWLNSIFWGDAIRPWLKDVSRLLPKDKQGLRRVYSKINNPSEVGNK